MSSYAVANIDEIDEMSDGRCPWRPIRFHFGIASFGVNAFTGREAGDRLINEHDESQENDLQEELYLVQRGRARFGKAYEAHGYELWMPLHHLYESGEYAEAADRGRESIEAHPEYAGPLYNLACCESLAGRKEDAIKHLGLAVARSEKMRAMAADDSDFDPIRDEAAFKELFSAG